MSILVLQVLSLNPCFSGNRFGRGTAVKPFRAKKSGVLILVLVEIGLGEVAEGNFMALRGLS